MKTGMKRTASSILAVILSVVLAFSSVQTVYAEPDAAAETETMQADSSEEVTIEDVLEEMEAETEEYSELLLEDVSEVEESDAETEEAETEEEAAAAFSKVAFYDEDGKEISNLTMYRGDKKSFSIRAFDFSSNEVVVDSVIYSDEPDVADLDADGKISAEMAGTATIYATINNAIKIQLDVTVKAPLYHVIFYGNGGTGYIAPISKVTYGNYITLPSTGFSVTGASLTSWNTKADGTGDSYTAGEDVKNLTQEENGLVELYAQWTYNKFSITYVMEHGTNSSLNVKTYIAGTGDVALYPPVRDGFTFEGWYLDEACTKRVTKIANGTTGDIVLYSKWRRHTYSVRFNANGGTGTMEIQTGFYYGFETALNANAFKRKGYMPAGWNTKADGSGLNYGNKQIVKRLTKEDGVVVDLYAKWLPRTYTITYKPRDGVNNEANITSYTPETATFTLLPATRTGYTFVGWYSDSALTKQVTKIKKGSYGNLTLYAKWRRNVYTVVFDANTGKGTMEAQTGFQYGLAVPLNANTFTKTGYVFTGWNTAADGSGTDLKDGQGAKRLTTVDGGSVTLYAQWRRYEYKIKFKANGGTGTTATMTGRYNSRFKLNACGYTYEGHSFKCWNTKADGSGTSYTDMQSVKNLGTQDGEVVVLYAQWNLTGTPILTAEKRIYNTVDVSWTAVTGANKYIVYRSTTADGVFKQIGTTSDTTFADTDFCAGSRYYYKVRAYNYLANGAVFIGPMSAVYGYTSLRTTADNIILFGIQFLGTPWVLGGTSLTQGLDCSSYTQQCYASVGIHCPRNSWMQAAWGSPVSSNIEEWKPGDFLGYTVGDSIGHAAIYIGDGWILQCSHSQGGVCISRYDYTGGPPAVIRRFF